MCTIKVKFKKIYKVNAPIYASATERYSSGGDYQRITSYIMLSITSEDLKKKKCCMNPFYVLAEPGHLMCSFLGELSL